MRLRVFPILLLCNTAETKRTKENGRIEPRDPTDSSVKKERAVTLNESKKLIQKGARNEREPHAKGAMRIIKLEADWVHERWKNGIKLSKRNLPLGRLFFPSSS